MTNLFDLAGRTAVVTGSAQGMGRAVAITLAEAGADLVRAMQMAERQQPGKAEGRLQFPPSTRRARATSPASCSTASRTIM
jgi:NAD(P)-dependent dehydrogenase (short-subunit alcohol dehydrogenase family)